MVHKGGFARRTLAESHQQLGAAMHQYGVLPTIVHKPGTQLPIRRLTALHKLATEYLKYLYSEESQRLLAGFNYRVHNEKVQAEFAKQFPTVDLLTVEQIIGGWDNAMKTQFANGAKLDELLKR